MKNKLALTFILASISGFVAVLYFAIQDYRKSSQVEVIPIETTPCDLQKEDCSFNHPKLGKVRFKVAPRPIKMNQEHKFTVLVNNLAVDAGWIDILGIDMDMGYNRPMLKKVDDNSLQAVGVLPTCTRPKMTWQATVILKTQEVLYGAPFKFDTFKE